jgi:crotonobetainyl-CoA:carnitine CoA-transferase CaiB-like acyl-CoA transferase
MSDADTPRGPLHGIRVLDLTQFLSGPFGTQILGDLGAEVIKIEAPGGELSRTVPPNFIEGDSAYYLSINRNKKNVCVDLKTAQGVELVRDLAAQCDVFIENNRPGVTARLGLGETELRGRDPRLVYCSLSGFGQSGPDRDLPAYDLIVQALSGGMSLTGEVGAPPVRAGIPLGDLTAGLYAVIGILSALLERQRTGQGRFIDIAMLDAQIAMLCYQGSYYLQSGRVPGPQGRGHDLIPTYRSFTCGDGVSLVVTANTERMWADLCRTLEVPELLNDPRFKDAHARLAHREALWETLDARFASAPAATWQERLRQASIPCGLVNSLDKALSAEQVAHRNMVLEMTSAAGSVVRVPGDPLKLGPPAPSYPAHLGQDTDSVLSSLLGIAPEQLRVLKNQGAISQYEPGAARGAGR